MRRAAGVALGSRPAVHRRPRLAPPPELRPRTIDDRVNRGRLHRVQHGVYSLFPPPYGVRQCWMAAVLSCGAGAALCGPSAAALQGVAELPGLPAHVRSPSRSGRGRPGMKVHRGAVDPRDLRIVDGIRTVSADAVLVDLAPHLSEAELEVVLVAAESKRLLKRGRLSELAADRSGRPGIPKLERLLGLEPAIVRSELELSGCFRSRGPRASGGRGSTIRSKCRAAASR